MTSAQEVVITRWWWVRHAPVRENNGCIYGQADLGCDCSDSMVFDGLARALPRGAQWVASNLKRTHQTAAAIWQAGFPTPDRMQREPDFAEQHLGEWQGLDRAAVYASRAEQQNGHWFGSPDERAPGGESFVDLCTRVERGIARFTAAHAGRDVVAVAHAGTIKAAIALALGLGPVGGRAFAIDNCSVTRLDHVELGERSGWRVAMVNYLPWIVPQPHQPAEPDALPVA